MVTRSGHFVLMRSQRLLNNPVFGISGAGLFVFLFGNPEEKNRLQPEILNALCFIDSFLHGQLKNPRHARDRPALIQFLTHEKRENKIVGAQLRLADKISQSRMNAANGEADALIFSQAKGYPVGGSVASFATGRIRSTGPEPT